MTAALVLAALLPAGVARGPVTAQTDRPDLAAGFPAEIRVTVLAEGVSETLPAAPIRIRLERINLAAGAGSSLAPNESVELYAIETGRLATVDDLGIEGVFAAGEGFLAQLDALYLIRNDGDDAASVLRLSLTAGAADTVHGAGDELLDDTFDEPPTGAGRLFIARATLDPGATAGPLAIPGAIGLVGESGSTSITTPEGDTILLGPGDPAIVQQPATVLFQNTGDEPAVFLIAGAIGPDQPLAVPQSPPPTAVPTITPTTAPMDTPTATGAPPTSTAVPPTATAVPPTETATGVPIETAQPIRTTETGVDGNAYWSPTWDFTLTWDDEVWTVDWDWVVAGGPDQLDRLVLRHGATSLWIEGVARYAGDAPTCLDGEASALANEPEVSDFAAAPGRDAPVTWLDAASGVYSLTYHGEGTAPVERVNAVICRPLTRGESVLIVTVIAPAADYNAQLAPVSAVLDTLRLTAAG